MSAFTDPSFERSRCAPEPLSCSGCNANTDQVSAAPVPVPYNAEILRFFPYFGAVPLAVVCSQRGVWRRVERPPHSGNKFAKRPSVTITWGSRARHFSLYGFRPRSSGLAWATAGLLLVSLTGCGRGAREIDSRLIAIDSSSITGTVRGPEGRSSVDGRAIEVVNIDSGERLRGSTNTTGGFSFRLKPGKYRMVLALRDGESLLREPGIIDVNRADAAVHADFVLGNVRVSRPRGPAYRTDDGLGSPIA
jgi:hypothetical protein